MNPDIMRERKNATFDVEKLTHILDGGPEKTKRRRKIESMVLSDPDLKEEDPSFLSRSENYDQGVKKSAQIILKLREYGIADPEEIYYFKKYVVNESTCEQTIMTSVRYRQYQRFDCRIQNGIASDSFHIPKVAMMQLGRRDMRSAIKSGGPF